MARRSYEDKVVQELLERTTVSLSPLLVEHEIDHLLMDECYKNIAYVYTQQDRYDSALYFFQQSFEIKRSVLGEGHPELMVSYFRIASVLDAKGQYEEALDQFQKILQFRIDPSSL